MPMSPTQPPAPVDPNPAGDMSPELAKAIDMMMQGAAKAYMESYKTGGPQSDALLSLQQAIAEVAKSYGAPGDPSMDVGAPAGAFPEADPAAVDQAMAPPPEDGSAPVDDAAMAPDEDAQLPPGYSMADAAGDTHQMMMAAAERRRQQP